MKQIAAIMFALFVCSEAWHNTNVPRVFDVDVPTHWFVKKPFDYHIKVSPNIDSIQVEFWSGGVKVAQTNKVSLRGRAGIRYKVVTGEYLCQHSGTWELLIYVWNEFERETFRKRIEIL